MGWDHDTDHYFHEEHHRERRRISERCSVCGILLGVTLGDGTLLCSQHQPKLLPPYDEQAATEASFDNQGGWNGNP